jgi:type VI secretion system secreted protein VgrG
LNVGIDVSLRAGRNLNVVAGQDMSVEARGLKLKTSAAAEFASRSITLASTDSVTIQSGSGSLSIKKDGTIDIKGKDVSITASGVISAKASRDVVIKGSKVAQN